MKQKLTFFLATLAVFVGTFSVTMPAMQGHNPVNNGHVAHAVQQYFDHSGTIASGGVSQLASASYASRSSLIIYNPNATDVLWFNFTNAAAVNGAGSIGLAPGQQFTTSGVANTSIEAIYVTGPTTGDGYTVKDIGAN